MTTTEDTGDTATGTWMPREEWIRTQPQALVASCVLVLDRRDRLLLLRYGPNQPDHGRWWLPGGMLDHGEDPSTAACRELDEETGIRLDAAPRLIGIDHRADVCGTGPVLDCYFYGGIREDLHLVRLSSEHDGHGLFAPDELGDAPLAPSHAATLRVLHAAAVSGSVACLREGRPV
ncbi:NUDIX hydrolase [Streptomyces sp. NPDC005573]|uniref:NUDIX hydrolase n=1 Tax=unclassified Streptomyces TaxID=2593676 RepID=UPI00339E91ED